MATYILLVSFTGKGIGAIKDTIKRAHDFREAAKKIGVEVKQEYWTLGHYDIVITVEAPDAHSVAALSANVGALGNVRTETLQAFNETEMADILKKVS